MLIDKISGNMHVNRGMQATNNLEQQSLLSASLGDVNIFEAFDHAVLFVNSLPNLCAFESGIRFFIKN